jgi:hypothetical protein
VPWTRSGKELEPLNGFEQPRDDEVSAPPAIGDLLSQGEVFESKLPLRLQARSSGRE